MVDFMLLLSAAAGALVDNVSLDQLRGNPQVYSGKMVRVAGQLDQCRSMSCNLCPTEATPAAPLAERCLALSFHRFRGANGKAGADMDAAFRYADLVVVARFDPSCLEGVCTDRATVLHDARVEQVMKRRQSREGLIHRPDPLLPAPANEAAAVQALLQTTRNDVPPLPVRVFATRSDPRLQTGAVVCWATWSPDEPIEWPTSWQGALTARSTEDPYRCSTAAKAASRWVLEPH